MGDDSFSPKIQEGVGGGLLGNLENIIEIRDLTSYGEILAVDHINFDAVNGPVFTYADAYVRKA